MAFKPATPLLRSRRARKVMPCRVREIRCIAEKVRSEVITGCSAGMCFDATDVLVEALENAGFPTCHAFGVFYVEDGWYEHHFAMIGNLVIDVTADQFNSTLPVPFPAVYVGPMARGKSFGHHCWQT